MIFLIYGKREKEEKIYFSYLRKECNVDGKFRSAKEL